MNSMSLVLNEQICLLEFVMGANLWNHLLPLKSFKICPEADNSIIITGNTMTANDILVTHRTLPGIIRPMTMFDREIVKSPSMPCDCLDVIERVQKQPSIQRYRRSLKGSRVRVARKLYDALGFIMEEADPSVC